MASRQETLERKRALRRDLLEAQSNGSLGNGDMAASQRALSLKYGLSKGTVAQEMRLLSEQGLLLTVPRVGTFVERPQAGRELFLYIKEDGNGPHRYSDAVRSGFEERIAELGGTCIALPASQVAAGRESWPTWSGVFQYSPGNVNQFGEGPQPPYVRYGERAETEVLTADRVYFDNQSGGQQATRHLLDLGHRRIAFLGLHAESYTNSKCLWSLQRAKGWKMALHEAGFSSQNLQFLPAIPITETDKYDHYYVSAHKTAETFLRAMAQQEITAVVSANYMTTSRLFIAMQERRLDQSLWPAMVSFDDDDLHEEFSLVSGLRLPWYEIGRTGANVLWRRSQGENLGEPRGWPVPMKLIPRWTSRENWSTSVPAEVLTAP